jgi:O-antigen ligase
MNKRSSISLSIDSAYYFLIYLLAFSLSFPSIVKSILIILLTVISLFKISKDLTIINLKEEFSFKNISVFYLILFFLKFISFLYSENSLNNLNYLERELSFLVFPICLTPFGININKGFKNNFYLSYNLGLIVLIIYSYFAATKYFIHRFPTLNFIDCFELTFMYQNFALWTYSHAGYLSIFIILGFFMLLELKSSSALFSEWKRYINLTLIVYVIVLLQLISVTPFVVFVVLLFFYLKRQGQEKMLTAFFPIVLAVFALFALYKANLLEKHFYLIPFFVIVGFFVFKKIVYLSTKTLLVTFFISAFLLPIILYLIVDNNPKMISYIYNHPSNLFYRYWNWKAAIEVIKENYLFGLGIIDAELMLSQKYNQLNMSNISNFNEHNQYLRMTIEMGILGAIVFLAKISFFIKNSIKSENFIFFALIVSIILFSITESIFLRHYGIIFFIFTSIILNKLYVQTKQH